jgi:glycosyltransferase involved in cell wall biosynthesis
MKKKKILFFGELPPLSTNGVSLSNKLNIDILERFYTVIKLIENRSDIDLRINYLRKLNSSFFNFVSLFFLCARYKPEIFYISLPSSKLGLAKIIIAFAFFRLFSNGNIVAHLHRGDFEEFIVGKLAFVRFLLAALKFFSPKIIVLSDSQKNIFQKLGFNNVESLFNSIIPPKIRKQKKSPRKAIFLTNYIVEKGLFYLLDSLKLLQDSKYYVRLDCFGAGDYSDYLRYARDIELKNVNFFGPIYGVDKFKTISSAEVLILPSLNEGQPLIIIEAMAMGTIVLATRVGLVEEMFDSNYPFLVPPSDSLNLANAISAALELEDKNMLARKLKNRFLKTFSHAVHEKNLLRIFHVFTSD